MVFNPRIQPAFLLTLGLALTPLVGTSRQAPDVPESAEDTGGDEGDNTSDEAGESDKASDAPGEGDLDGVESGPGGTTSSS